MLGLQLLVFGLMATAVFGWAAAPRCFATQRQPLKMSSNQWDDEDEQKKGDDKDTMPKKPSPQKPMSMGGIMIQTGDGRRLSTDEIARARKQQGFDEADDALIKEAEEKELEKWAGGEDDYLEGSETSSQGQLRDAIKKRTSSLGMEESQISKDAIKEAERRAAARMGSGGFGLDLSQVTYGDEGEKKQLSMDYRPEDELTDEQMKEADPIGQMPYWDQAKEELKLVTFPGLERVVTRGLILLVLGSATAFGFIETDNFVREFYRSKGLLPTTAQLERFQDERNKLTEELTAKGVELPPLPKFNVGTMIKTEVDNLIGSVTGQPTPKVSSPALDALYAISDGASASEALKDVGIADMPDVVPRNTEPTTTSTPNEEDNEIPDDISLADILSLDNKQTP